MSARRLGTRQTARNSHTRGGKSGGRIPARSGWPDRTRWLWPRGLDRGVAPCHLGSTCRRHGHNAGIERLLVDRGVHSQIAGNHTTRKSSELADPSPFEAGNAIRTRSVSLGTTFGPESADLTAPASLRRRLRILASPAGLLSLSRQIRVQYARNYGRFSVTEGRPHRRLRSVLASSPSGFEA